MAHFASIEDPRMDINVKHDLLEVLFLTVTAVISGCEGWKDIYDFGQAKLSWLRQYRAFANGIPVDDTIARIISALVPEKFTEWFIDWVNELRSYAGKEIISIDGKTLKHSFQTNDRQTALHSITVWSKSNGLILAQSGSEGKKNENKTVLELLDLVELKGTVITVDAMNTQRKIADKIQSKKADYILAAKDNQKNLKAEIKEYFEYQHKNNRSIMKENSYIEEDIGHGRIEKRSYTQLMINELIPEAKKWAGVKSIIEVKRERYFKVNKKQENEVQYYISSLPIDVKFIANAIRSHWEGENKAHWVLDIIYKEDASRIRRENAAENLAVIRRLALNLARLNPIKNSMRGKLRMAMWSDEIRHEIVFGQNQDKV